MYREDAETLDRADPLAAFRDRFAMGEPGPVYLDGNSLGAPSDRVEQAVARGLRSWREELVGGWDEWIDMPGRVGDRLGGLLGAAPGQVLVCDSTTVNLYKLAAAGLAARPDRRAVVVDSADFPTDRYVIEGLASDSGRYVRNLPGPADNYDPPGPEAVAAVVDGDTALVCLSHVNFRSGARTAVPEVTAEVHERGALVLWDLAHSAGALPVHLDEWGVDLAVGCTYKYLNAGPGAPAFLYVSHDLQDRLRQPIWGWFGQADQFGMGPRYEPARGITSYLTGTPNVIGTMMVAAAVEIVEEAGVDALWQKSRRLTEMLVGLIDTHLAPLGASLASPRRPEARGAHVSVSHPQAWSWCRTLVTRGLVVGDFRPPDVIRLGPAPLYTRFVDCYDAIEAMAEVLADGVEDDAAPRRVT